MPVGAPAIGCVPEETSDTNTPERTRLPWVIGRRCVP
jgi:hypothetical protein